MSENYTLDGYTLIYLPGPGGYSGYNPKRRLTEVQTISSNVTLNWGTVVEDQIITLTAPYCSRAEFLSLQGRYQTNDVNGAPSQFHFTDSYYHFDVELLDLNGNPYRGIYQNPELTMKILSVLAI